MKLTKTLLTSALLGASLFSFHSTAWADTPEQQFQQGLEATKRGDLICTPKVGLNNQLTKVQIFL